MAQRGWTRWSVKVAVVQRSWILLESDRTSVSISCIRRCTYQRRHPSFAIAHASIYRIQRSYLFKFEFDANSQRPIQFDRQTPLVSIDIDILRDDACARRHAHRYRSRFACTIVMFEFAILSCVCMIRLLRARDTDHNAAAARAIRDACAIGHSM